MTREAREPGTRREVRDAGKVPDRGLTRVSTREAEGRDRGKNRDHGARGRVQAIEGQDGKFKDANFYREGAKVAKESKRFSC